jgi:hypothetical protein
MKLTLTFMLSIFLCLSLQAQGNKEKTTTAKQPTTPVVKDTLPYDKLKMPIQYVSSGDKNPLNKEDKEHLNVQGASSCLPEYIEGKKEIAARAIKMKLFKKGACGIVHFMAELVVNNKGQVEDVRILRVEPDAQRVNVFEVLKELQFTVGPNCPEKQTLYQEYKFDIRCDNKPASGNIKKVPNYITK